MAVLKFTGWQLKNDNIIGMNWKIGQRVVKRPYFWPKFLIDQGFTENQ